MIVLNLRTSSPGFFAFMYPIEIKTIAISIVSGCSSANNLANESCITAPDKLDSPSGEITYKINPINSCRCVAIKPMSATFRTVSLNGLLFTNLIIT